MAPVQRDVLGLERLAAAGAAGVGDALHEAGPKVLLDEREERVDGVHAAARWG